ncbi:hypothetical protein [Clostridium botulinum]|uniref:hypothetical protein n=1 Tax=Clostridium botulinum TaxID=1491 RepID=UPI0004D7CE4B|nr:hypothetical protein [Clostridium botulinum]KEH90473.1 hypothetical protein Z963_p0029 [Clostridium botulinum C/D str. It1]
MSRKITIEEVEQYVKENSQCELLSTVYVNARTNLRFRCKCGKEFERTFDNFKRKKTTLCKSCSNIRPLPPEAKLKIAKARRKPMQDVLKIVETEMGCKFIDRYTKPNTRSTIIVFECPEHGIQEAYWTNLVKRKGCPICNEHNKQNSKGMIKVEKWLKCHDIIFEKEYKFEGCRDKRKLPFDYFLPIEEVCIEVDGRQHFEKAYFGNVDEEKATELLEYIKRHDEMKNKFCKENNIRLIRIPYYEIDNIDKILKSAL